MKEEPVPLESVDPESAALETVSVEDVREAFASPDPMVRHHAGDVSIALAVDHAEAMDEFVPVLSDALSDESVVVVQKAGAALVPLAERRPDAFENHVPALVDLYRHEISTARTYAAKLLGTFAVEQPALLAPHVEALVDVLVAASESTDGVADAAAAEPFDSELHATMARHDDAELKRTQASQETVANAIVAVAEARPKAVPPAFDAVTDALQAADTIVRSALIDVIAAVAESDTESARACVSALDAQLDHEHPMVRARAIRALGFTGVSSMEPTLRRVATDDEDADVRSLAAETADFLAAH